MLSGIMMLLAATAAQTADPLAPAREGKLHCYTPDAGKKTCVALSSFTAGPDGSWRADTTMLLAPAPLTIFTSSSVVTVEGAAMCGPVLREDIMAGTVTMGGIPLPAEQAAPVLEQIAGALSSMIGTKACTTLRPDGDVLVAESTLDGVAAPQLTQRLIWVAPDEGYRVGQ